MAPPKKKKKLSKQARKEMMEERSKKALEKRGLGSGSRMNFTLASNWKKEEYQSGEQTRVRFVSPGKTKYNTQKTAGEALRARNLADCFHDKSTTSEDGNTENDSEYNPYSDSESEKGNLPCGTNGLEVERRLFVCESTQLMDMVHQINLTSKCSTPKCNGK